MNIDRANKYFIEIPDDESSYIDYNWQKIVAKHHSIEITLIIESAIKELMKKSKDLVVKNLSRESMACYILNLRRGREILSIWISIPFKYYVFFAPYSKNKYVTPAIMLDHLKAFKDVIESHWEGYTHVPYEELKKINPFAVGFLKKTSTVCEVIFGDKLLF